MLPTGSATSTWRCSSYFLTADGKARPLVAIDYLGAGIQLLLASVIRVHRELRHSRLSSLCTLYSGFLLSDISANDAAHALIALRSTTSQIGCVNQTYDNPADHKERQDV